MIIMNPGVDASDKQIFAGNNYYTNADIMMNFMKNKDA